MTKSEGKGKEEGNLEALVFVAEEAIPSTPHFLRCRQIRNPVSLPNLHSGSRVASSALARSFAAAISSLLAWKRQPLVERPSEHSLIAMARMADGGFYTVNEQAEVLRGRLLTKPRE
jgi:hypothetical protein